MLRRTRSTTVIVRDDLHQALEHVVAAMREMLVELQPRQRPAQQTRQRLLAHLERLAPQVVAVKLEKSKATRTTSLVIAAMP